MRLLPPRASAFVTLLVVLATVLGLVAHRDRLTRGGRDGMFRITRGGLQRLDAADAISQDESPDPTVARASEASSEPVVGASVGPNVGAAVGAAVRANVRAHAPRAVQSNVRTSISRRVTGQSPQGRSSAALAYLPPVAVAGPPGHPVRLAHVSDPASLLSRARHPIPGRAPPSV
jgi:hypothetical protein